MFRRKKSPSPPAGDNGSRGSGSSHSSGSSGSTQADNANCTFTVGVAEDRNRKCRKTMEDAHTYIYNFGDSRDAGFFAVYDGHAGHQCAEWCSLKMHTYVSNHIQKNGPREVSKALNDAFLDVDSQIARLNVQSSGCTAAVAVLRWEDDPAGPTSQPSGDESPAENGTRTSVESGSGKQVRKLYVANVGDTRVVLSRGGRAYRLSYDHKGSDAHEAKRIQNVGGIMMNNRVSGVLAVTRSLGDCYMKELVTGAPYTTETRLRPEDEFIIIACDGLWDVCTDETAVSLIREVMDPEQAARVLVNHALENFSTDNLTCMVVRLDQEALA